VAAERFSVITEVEARRIEPGATVELEPGGRITALAQDTLTERRVTVVRQAAKDGALPKNLTPVFPVVRVVIGADHGGVALKAALIEQLRAQKRVVIDAGTNGPAPVDYPDIAAAVADTVARGDADAGIVIDGAGLGSAIAANKIRGVRAAMCTTPLLARYSREHNGANVLSLGATLVSTETAREIVDTWLSTPMREERYIRRLMKVRKLEDRS
jgi:ribose 5-phosphate isomerase B